MRLILQLIDFNLAAGHGEQCPSFLVAKEQLTGPLHAHSYGNWATSSR